MSDNTWKNYSTTAPTNNGYEVNVGYVNGGILSTTNNGGTLVSKLLVNNNSEIHYVDRSVVSSMISNGIYTYSGVVSANFIVTESGDFIVTESGDFIIA